MNEATPLDILVKEFLPVEAALIEKQILTIEDLPVVKMLAELLTPVYGNDPDELIARRFLYRAAVALLMGPTGIGKSSFVMQLAIYLAVGRALFGIEPGAYYRGRGMRVLLVQAENDEGDLAEMRDGVLKGCTDLSEEEKRLALERMAVVTICDRSAERFTEALEALLVKHGPFDLVIVDPAFAYLGGDSNSQADVSHFMRELINPLLQKHRVGMILCHHTNKPLRGKEKDGWAAGDFAYLGAGSAEWINPARAALALRSIGSDRVFELRAAKRGRRLGWTDEDGEPTNAQYIAHHDEPGVICWRRATAEEVAELMEPEAGVGRPRKCDLVEVLHCINRCPGRNQSYYQNRIADRLECSKAAVQHALAMCVESGLLDPSKEGGSNRYKLTKSALSRIIKTPSEHDWNDTEYRNAENE
jgi:hypothetical protein